MDKDRKEAVQVAKELAAKFIETRNISPGNFAEQFPAIFRVVYATIRSDAPDAPDDLHAPHAGDAPRAGGNGGGAA